MALELFIPEFALLLSVAHGLKLSGEYVRIMENNLTVRCAFLFEHEPNSETRHFWIHVRECY